MLSYSLHSLSKRHCHTDIYVSTASSAQPHSTGRQSRIANMRQRQYSAIQNALGQMCDGTLAQVHHQICVPAPVVAQSAEADAPRRLPTQIVPLCRSMSRQLARLLLRNPASSANSPPFEPDLFDLSPERNPTISGLIRLFGSYSSEKSAGFRSIYAKCRG